MGSGTLRCHMPPFRGAHKKWMVLDRPPGEQTLTVSGISNGSTDTTVARWEAVGGVMVCT